jgi:hypothetical protein
MIKKHLTTLICLHALALVNSYSFLEVVNASHSHLQDHILHQSFTFILSILFLLVYFRNNLFLKNGSLSKIKILTVLIIFIFSFVHLSPTTLNFTSHHQSQSQDGSQHPCCMPQVMVVVIPFQLEIISDVYERFNENSDKQISLTSNSINNKSPPLS